MRRSHPRKSRRGAAMVEGAIVISVFLTLVLGMIDLSIGVFQKHVVSQAARQGARMAMVRGKMAAPKLAAWGPGAYSAKGNAGDDIALAMAPFLTGLDPSNVDLKIDWIDGDHELESRVRVTVSTTWTPIMLSIFNGSKTLTASATVPIAH